MFTTTFLRRRLARKAAPQQPSVVPTTTQRPDFLSIPETELRSDR